MVDVSGKPTVNIREIQYLPELAVKDPTFDTLLNKFISTESPNEKY